MDKHPQTNGGVKPPVTNATSTMAYKSPVDRVSEILQTVATLATTGSDFQKKILGRCLAFEKASQGAC